MIDGGELKILRRVSVVRVRFPPSALTLQRFVISLGRSGLAPAEVGRAVAPTPESGEAFGPERVRLGSPISDPGRCPRPYRRHHRRCYHRRRHPCRPW